MATETKNAIIKALLEGKIVELMFKSNIDNIFMSDGETTLAAKLAEIISSINDINEDIKTIPTSTTVDNKISTAINDLINGAPETYDTLKEIADYLTTHQDEYTALLTIVTGKVDKESGKGLSTNDYTTAEKNKLAGIANNANNYTLPAATSSVLGGVKIGSNISNSSGTISLSKANVTAALGYTPPTQDTTYSDVTTSASGLMSANDKNKLDGIANNANNYTLPAATSSVLGGVKIGSNISNSSGTISLSKANVTAALGYTPPTTADVSAKPDIYIQTTQPTNLKSNDIWIQITD